MNQEQAKSDYEELMDRLRKVTSKLVGNEALENTGKGQVSISDVEEAAKDEG